MDCDDVWEAVEWKYTPHDAEVITILLVCKEKVNGIIR